MWVPTTDVKYGVAIYRFRGKDSILLKCLPLEIGETVQILEQSGEWYRGFSTKNKNIKGIFPVNYIQPKPAKVTNEGAYETVVPVGDNVVHEVHYVLNEWLTKWKRHYVRMNQAVFRKVREDMTYLIRWRKQLISGTLTHEQSMDLKADIARKIDLGNAALGLDLTPRLNHEEVDPDAVSIAKLCKLHREGVELARNPKGGPTSKKVKSCHLYFLLRNFPYNVGEEMEIFFGLYNSKNNCYITEKFMVRHYVNEDTTGERRDARSAVFTDMGQGDFKDIFIVAQIYRRGAMLMEDGGKSAKKKSSYAYRRPFGCAVLSINDVQLNQFSDQDKEFHLPVYYGENRQWSSEQDFSSLPDMIIRKEGVGRCGFKMAIAMRLLYGDLETVKRENPLVFTRTAAVCKNLGVADIIRPGDVRNDLYITLRGGEFEKGKKTAPKNVEVKICIVDDKGKIIPNALEIGKSQPPVTEFVSSVYYHNNSPRWQETFRINIPMEQFDSAHFRASLRHCSNNRGNTLFGMSFSKLMKHTGAPIDDAQHKLNIYKCEDISKLSMHEIYLTLSSRFDDSNQQTNTLLPRSTKEYLIVQTTLCSTKYTQNVDLLNFLQLDRRANHDDLCSSIDKLKILNDVEIVKFLPDIFDALFSMLTIEKISTQVFQAVVHTCRVLTKSQFEHYRPFMDNYIEKDFSATLVYRDILKALHDTAKSVPTLKDRACIDSAFRTMMVMKYLLRFAVQSRKLYCGASTGESADDRFMEMLVALFGDFNTMIGKAESEEASNLQVLLLRDLCGTFPVLLETISVQELGDIVCTFMDTVSRDQFIPVRRQYMKFLKDVVNSPVFVTEVSRRSCLPIILCKIRVIAFIEKTEIDIGAQIVCDILDFLLAQEKSDTVDKDIELVIVTLMEVITQTIQRVDRDSSTRTQLITCLIMMFKIMSERHYKALFGSLDKREPMKNFLLMVFNVFEMLVKTNIYPKDWIVMRMATNSVIQETMQYFGQLLTDQFLSDGHFNFQVWDSYFRLGVAFVTQRILQLEKYSHPKREKILTKYSDMRIPMAVDIHSMWQSLGTYKSQFIPHMVGPFLEVTVVPETELRKATLPIFFDMMECEQRDRGNFRMVESELIDKLDILVSQNKGDDEYKELFQNMMESFIDKIGEYLMLQDRVDAEPEWKETGSAFIKSVTRLLERLLDYRRVMEGESNYSQKMLCTVNLLHFYKNDINREEMYIRYIYKLTSLHIKAEYYTEAAFTRLLHAHMLDWTPEEMGPTQEWPAQKAEERKEAIYKQAIQDFDRGKAWEYCFALCQELVTYYSNRYDYVKLSNLLKLEASFYDKILNELRLDPTYFRLGFYGLPFPSFVKNKTFIFRGGDCERFTELKNRILAEHPYAQVLDRTSPPDDSIMNGDIPYIQLYVVKPVPSNSLVLSMPNVCEKISSFYKVNQIDTFQYDRPFQDGERDPNNDFKTLCLERTVMKTTGELPGILKHCEVVESHTIVLRPIETAIDVMRNKNSELRSLIGEYIDNPGNSVHPLTMRLGGVIDAAVQGGTAKYKEAFLTNDFSIEHPEHGNDISTLWTLIGEQIKILKDGMEIHEKCIPPDVRPLHDKLVIDLKRMTKIMGGSRMSATSAMSDNSDPFMNESRPISQTSSGNRSIDSVTSGTFSAAEDLEQPIYQDSESLVEDLDAQGLNGGGHLTPDSGVDVSRLSLTSRRSDGADVSPSIPKRSPSVPPTPVTPLSPGQSDDNPPELPVTSRKPSTNVFDVQGAPPQLPPKQSRSSSLNPTSPNNPSQTADYRHTTIMAPLNEEGAPPPFPRSRPGQQQLADRRPPLPPRGTSMLAKVPPKPVVSRRRPSCE